MLNSYIELIISLIVIYALLSTLVSLMNELYRSVIRDRGRMLFSYVRRMMRDEKNVDLAYLTFRHPLIDNARHNDQHRPAYIDPKLFATALIQTVGDLSVDYSYTLNKNGNYDKKETRDENPLNRFIAGVKTMKHSSLRSTLLGMAERAQMDNLKPYDVLEAQIIDWFNNQMSTLSTHYKTRQRKSLLFFGFVVTIFLNIDSIYLVHELRNDPQMRLSITSKADEIQNNYSGLVEEITKNEMLNNPSDTVKFNSGIKNTIAKLKNVNEEVKLLELPIGYSRYSAPVSWFFANSEENQDAYDKLRNNPGFLSIVLYLAGLIISAFSLSLGAPFWFDMLNKTVNLKGGGK